MINKKRIIKKILCIALITVVVVFICIVVSILVATFKPALTEGKMSEIFEEDKELLKQVAEYLEKNDAVWQKISREESWPYSPELTLLRHNYSLTFQRVSIDELEIGGVIDILFKQRHYHYVEKNSNTIFFERSSDNLRFNGIAYTFDNVAPVHQGLKRSYSLHSSKLSETNWYYYEFIDINYASKLTNNSSQYFIENNTEELLGFSPRDLLLGRAFGDIKEAYHDFVYADDNYEYDYDVDVQFYSAERKIWAGFRVINLYGDIKRSEVKDFNAPTNEEAIALTVSADAEMIFPDMPDQISKADIEAVIGTKVLIRINEDSTSKLYGEYIAHFSYKGYSFVYLPDDVSGNVFMDTFFRVE